MNNITTIVELQRLTTFEGLNVGDTVTRITITGFQTFQFMGYDPKLINTKNHFNYAFFLDAFGRTKTERWYIDYLQKTEIYKGYDTLFVKIVESNLLQKRLSDLRLDIPLALQCYKDNPLKITFEDIQVEYQNSEVVIGETLASIPADGLSLEEAFELYMEALKSSCGDRFFREVEDSTFEEFNGGWEDASDYLGILKESTN